ncbi:uncharacterized protein [Anoplolepis gracilipes]|uniref:uncharacterized protein n=1 Tax=Anoplolepis gracilipes TaxID=354296 RepID=UPI003BA266EB
MCLPEEVIDIILGYNDITIEDIINFRCVCKKFRHVAKYNKFMGKKFLQRKPVCKQLTERYINMQFFDRLRQYKLMKKRIKLEMQPLKVQLLERIATIMAQNFQPEKDVFYSTVTSSLDSITLEVLKSLRQKHPDHLIFSTSTEKFSYWENNNIDDNHWNEAEGTQIMDTLEECIFGKLNFRLNKSENTEWNTQLKYKCIDNVLEHKYGQEIIIYTIYHSVARRLGLRCDIIIGYPDERICLLWKPRYFTNSSENVRCFKINSNKFPDCFIKQQQFVEFNVITVTKQKDAQVAQVRFINVF